MNLKRFFPVSNDRASGRERVVGGGGPGISRKNKQEIHQFLSSLCVAFKSFKSNQVLVYLLHRMKFKMHTQVSKLKHSIRLKIYEL